MGYKTKKERNAHLAGYRKQVAGRTCECGNPASEYRSTAFICARCARIQDLFNHDKPVQDRIKPERARIAKAQPSRASAIGSATCQHRMGHYCYTGTRTTGEEYKQCGKRATHIAKYPDRPPFYLCRKHAKTRCYVSELPNDPSSATRRKGGDKC